MRDMLQHALYRHGWDTRCRNLMPAQVLRPLLGEIRTPDAPPLLDVGCGRLGLAGFLDGVPVVGLDVEPPAETAPNFSFRQGSITDLPFEDRTFPVVSCVDVLEHLPLAARDRAITELVRVASRAVLIACPHGPTARDCDEEFRRALETHRRPVPDWVVEHQGQPYPTSSEIVERVRRAAAASGRRADISLSYCEPARACRLVRGSAARSDLLYTAVNLLLGSLLPLMPAPDAENSYRVIVLARLSSEGAAGAA